MTSINFFDTKKLQRKDQYKIKVTAMAGIFLVDSAFIASTIFTTVVLFKNQIQNQHIAKLKSIFLVAFGVFLASIFSTLSVIAASRANNKLHLDESKNKMIDAEISGTS